MRMMKNPKMCARTHGQCTIGIHANVFNKFRACKSEFTGNCHLYIITQFE